MPQTTAGTCAVFPCKSRRRNYSGIAAFTLTQPEWATFLFVFYALYHMEKTEIFTGKVEQFTHGFLRKFLSFLRDFQKNLSFFVR